MATLPSSLALTSIADGSLIVAADHRNNYNAVQTEANALLTILGAGVTGQVFTGNGTTVAWAYPPGYEIAYAQITANVTGIAGTTYAGSSSIVAAPTTVFDGTPVWVEFYSSSVNNNTDGARVIFSLGEGATDLGIITSMAAGGASVGQAVYGKFKFTPSAASHTYQIVAFVNAGTGQVVAGAGGAGVNVPAFIRFTKV